MADLMQLSKALLLLCLVALPEPSLALPYMESERAALIQSGQQQDGTYLLGLRITLKPGWMTYWRHPGEAGLAPIIKTEGSQNLKRVQVFYPAPALYVKDGYKSLGYENEVIFPLALMPENQQEPVLLKLDFTYGICEKICLPKRVSFHVGLEQQTKIAERQILLLAKSRVPRQQANLIKEAQLNDRKRINILLLSGSDYRFGILETDSDKISVTTRKEPNSFIFDLTGLQFKNTLRLTFIGEKDAVVTTYNLPQEK